ncbi:MAG: hypothetical protein QNJ68_03545 [Microcoleaceae cyanobacterium MO_207.B10]|nr:hypothetical protein [Microcoleaceae cyanobacterium MO_207.B10]
MKSCIFIGDGRADKSVYLEGVNKIGISRLPINDHTLKRLFRVYSNPDVIFWSCSFPLMGCSRIKTIENLQTHPPQFRLIPFDKVPYDRGFYHSTFWKGLSESQLNLLFVNWKEMIEHYYNLQPKVVLLPLAAHYYDIQLGLDLSAMETIKQFDRVVDLSPLNSAENLEDIYADKYGQLSKAGWDKIEANILRWLE